ncbi:MAG: M28 family peptidase, partial [Anaerolineae bacterium]|nr:M28 family peptidase [Anaerolineae bacterium]
FYGYWDNAIGVAGILTIAKSLHEIGYRPKHTLLFVSPDAEEFGAPDTAYGWLYGCHRLLEAHPEWAGRMTCALNIDTLAHRWQQGIQFIGPAEMLTFMRRALAGYQVQHFPQTTVGITEQITPWTEVFNYTYFGIPSIQPRFKTENDFVRTTVYHTQLDDASLVDLNGAAEILKLYGTLLLLLDQQAAVPYDFTARAQSIRQALDYSLMWRFKIDPAPLNNALDGFEQWAIETSSQLAQLNGSNQTALAAFNDDLRARLRQLLPGLYYTETDFPDSGRYEHLFWQRDLLALEKALACLNQRNAAGAIAALTDPASGVQGGWYALNVSYPVYHRSTSAARNPARADLLWGAGRTIPLTDVWTLLHELQDKARRGLTDFASERHNLAEKLAAAVAGYQQALEKLRLALVRAAA